MSLPGSVFASLRRDESRGSAGAWRKRSHVSRGGVLAARIALLLLAVGVLVMRSDLGAAAWLLLGTALAGLLVLTFSVSEESDAKDSEDAYRIAEEAIRREAKRLDSRRAEIEKVLMAYGEWMEFPDFDEIREAEWATPERSARDAEVAKLLDAEADQFLAKVSAGEFWEGGQFQSRFLLLQLWDFVERIAKIYNPDSEKPLLETNLEELLKSLNRASLQVILLLEEFPLIDVKDLNLRQVADGVRKASTVVKKYEDLQPVLGPVRYLWQGSKFLIASNPLVAAGWIAGSKLVGKAGKTIGKRTLDAYLLSLVRQTLGIVAWETASIYDKTSRYRDPEWVYGVELAHLVSEFPLTRDTLREALRELGTLPFRSSYERVFLYRCVAQHVSPKPERFAQPELLTEETRVGIGERLQKFFRKHVDAPKEKQVVAWRTKLGKRLGITFSEAPDQGTVT